jgi:molecular chaperone GrpE
MHKSIKKDIKQKEGKKIIELRSQLARALADYDNLAKRVGREREELSKITSLGILIRLLPVLDNLESAQEHLQDQGLAISIGEFKKVLDEEDLVEIKPRPGDTFDENLHEAIETVEGGEKGKIAEVVLTGWKFKEGQAIRVAKVKVYN